MELDSEAAHVSIFTLMLLWTAAAHLVGRMRRKQAFRLRSTGITVEGDLISKRVQVSWNSPSRRRPDRYNVKVEALQASRGCLQNLLGYLVCDLDGLSKGTIEIHAGYCLPNGEYSATIRLFAGQEFKGNLRLA